MLRNVINKLWRRLWRHLSRTLTLKNFSLSVSPDDYRSCRLIQVFCHKYSFVFVCIIVIRLEAGLTNWLTVNLLKKYKIKENLLFWGKYQIYFILWVENIKIFIRAARSWKFWCFQHTRWNIFGIHLKKVNILYIILCIYLYKRIWLEECYMLILTSGWQPVMF